MYIEFTGCSGSGKSTISARLIDRLRMSQVRFSSIHPQCFSALGPRFEKVRNPTLQNILLDINGTYRLVRSRDHWDFLQFADRLLCRNTVSIITRLNLLRSVNRKLGIHSMMRAPHDPATLGLVDEGIVHSAHNLLVHSHAAPQDADIATFGQMVPMPDLIVLVRAPVEMTIERTLRRTDKPIAGGTEQLTRYLENANRVYDRLFQVERLRERAIFLDYDEDSIDLADELALKALTRINTTSGRA